MSFMVNKIYVVTLKTCTHKYVCWDLNLHTRVDVIFKEVLCIHNVYI